MDNPARWLSFGIAFQAVCHPQQQQLSVLDEWVHIYIFKKKIKNIPKAYSTSFFSGIKFWLCEKVLDLVPCFAYQHD